MKHVIYPERTNDDGETEPAVVVDVPDTLYLQVVDVDDCEDFPAPSEPSERTFTTERLNASDVAYVPAARAERAEAEAEALRAQLDTAQEAAHMPDDWPHGLPSWVNQRLYAAYIGAAFSPDVMEQIRAGRLTFPEAPIYAERDELRADLDAARATLASAVTVSIGGALHRVLPAPVGYSGDSETVWRVEHGGLVVQQFGLSKAAPGDSREEAG